MIVEGEKYEVEIVDLGSSGEGIGKAEGMTIFVNDGIPGDFVLVEITQLKKNYAKGRLIKILSPSKARRKPPCQHAEECGGCSLQAIDYEGQLALKEKWVKDSLTRIGGVVSPKVNDIVGMENPWRYRNKVQFSLSGINSSEKRYRSYKIGFYKSMSHEVADCESCLLQALPVEYISRAIREYITETGITVYDEKTKKGMLRHVVIKTAFGTGEIMVVLVSTERRLPDVRRLIDKIQGALEKVQDEAGQKIGGYSFESLILNINKQINGPTVGKENITLAGKTTIKDSLMGMDFEISPLSFYQVNPVQTEKLYEKVREYAALTGEETVIDLYCGVGTIGLLLAQDAKRVIGIETVKAAVIDANRNATINGIVNAEYICGKAEDELPKLLGQGVQSDVIILDPPRAGCEPALLKAAATAGPQRIIYVSCDPATLARDVKILTEFGYRFIEAQPVDMFPHTGHVETVVLMSRKDT